MQKQKISFMVLLILLTTTIIIDNIPKYNSNLVCAVQESDELIYKVVASPDNETQYGFVRVYLEEYGQLPDGTINVLLNFSMSEFSEIPFSHEEIKIWKNLYTERLEISSLDDFQESIYFFPLDVDLRSIYQDIETHHSDYSDYTSTRLVTALKKVDSIESGDYDIIYKMSFKYNHQHILSRVTHTSQINNTIKIIEDEELVSTTVTPIAVYTLTRISIYSILLLGIIFNAGIFLKTALFKLSERKIINKHISKELEKLAASVNSVYSHEALKNCQDNLDELISVNFLLLNPDNQKNYHKIKQIINLNLALFLEFDDIKIREKNSPEIYHESLVSLLKKVHEPPINGQILLGIRQNMEDEISSFQTVS